MTPVRKEEVKEAFINFFSDMDISSEKMPDNSIYCSVEEEEEFSALQELFKLRNITLEEFFACNKPYTLDEIYEIISKDPNRYSIGYFEEISEVEDFIEDRKEKKYQYHVIIFKYLEEKNSSKFFKIVEQRSNDVVLNVEFHGEVKKKETITYEWI